MNKIHIETKCRNFDIADLCYLQEKIKYQIKQDFNRNTLSDKENI